MRGRCREGEKEENTGDRKGRGGRLRGNQDGETDVKKRCRGHIYQEDAEERKL